MSALLSVIEAAPSSEKAIAGVRFLELLDLRERAALAAVGRIVRVPAGAAIMCEGETGGRVIVLLSGRMKVTRVSDDGREALCSIRDPGDILGEMALIDGRERISTVTAMERAEMLAISPPAFNAIVDRSPAVARALLVVLAGRLREATCRQAAHAGSDALGRVAACLVELCDRYGSPCDDGVAIELPVTQEELRAWSGCSRASIAKALQKLRELGWVRTQRRGLVVRDIDALRRRAAGSKSAALI
jgi:CRP-like cAMP-binding protein